MKLWMFCGILCLISLIRAMCSNKDNYVKYYGEISFLTFIATLISYSYEH